MNEITQVWGKVTEPYFGDKEYKRIKVYYTKNGRDQYAVYMDYGQAGKPNYKIIEDNAYSRNRLTEQQAATIGVMINNESIIIKE